MRTGSTHQDEATKKIVAKMALRRLQSESCLATAQPDRYFVWQSKVEQLNDLYITKKYKDFLRGRRMRVPQCLQYTRHCTPRHATPRYRTAPHRTTRLE